MLSSKCVRNADDGIQDVISSFNNVVRLYGYADTAISDRNTSIKGITNALTKQFTTRREA